MTGILLMYCKQYKVTDVPDGLLDTLAETLVEIFGCIVVEGFGDTLVGPVFHKA